MKRDPFTSVYRGRVISVTDRQHVQGGGIVMAGWGGMRVNTVTVNEFWLKSPEFGDLCFKMGASEPPPMLKDHAVTVVTAGEKVCAMACDCLWLDIGQPDDYNRAQEIYNVPVHQRSSLQGGTAGADASYSR